MDRNIPMTMAIRALKAAGAEFEARTYPYVPHGGTAQAAAALGLDHHATIKTIILEDADAKPLVCLMHGDREISVKNLARAIGTKTVRPCEVETAQRHSGYLVGGTSPFGTRKRMRVFVEKTIYDLPLIHINGGHRGVLVTIAPQTIDKVLGPLATHASVAAE